jgi:hypothetical protein
MMTPMMIVGSGGRSVANVGIGVIVVKFSIGCCSGAKVRTVTIIRRRMIRDHHLVGIEDYLGLLAIDFRGHFANRHCMMMMMMVMVMMRSIWSSS